MDANCTHCLTKFNGIPLCAVSAPGGGEAGFDQVTAPTLAEFMSSQRPAWLWDAERARIVWANAEGVRWLGGETLFDIIDQPFDAEDEAVARIKALARELPHGATAHETLRLPAPAGNAPVACRCSVHALSDGRAGLLVVADDGSTGESLPSGLAHEMLMVLPLGIVLASPEGAIRFANAAARDLVGDERLESFGQLIEDADHAQRLLSRAANLRLASAVVAMPTRYGRREVRVTAKLLGPIRAGGGAPIVILLDDVTDRRTLERALSGTSGGITPEVAGEVGGEAGGEAGAPSAAPQSHGAAERARHKLSASERRTFEALAAAILKGPEAAAEIKATEAATDAQAGEPAEAFGEPSTSPAPEPTIPPQPADAGAAPTAAAQSLAGGESPDDARPDASTRLPEVPALVSRALDTLPQAVVLHRQAELLFANRAAIEAFGFADQAEFLACRDIGARLAQAHSGEVVLPAAGGSEQRFRLTRSSFPWNTGPVSQSTLVPVSQVPVNQDRNDTTRTEVIETRLAEKAAEPGDGEAPQAAEPAAPAPMDSDGAAVEPARLAWEPVDAELRAILDTATDGIITLDENGHIRGFSAGAEALFGYRLSQVAGRPFTDLLAPESRKVVRNYLAALDHSGLASVFNDGREVEAVMAQGTVPLFIAIGRIGATSGATAGSGQAYCVVVRDLTQWKKTEAELRRSKEEAERASAQKSEFLANISHELRTPLNAILGFSEVMRSQRFGALSNQKYLGYANDIHESGEHLLSLINDLLDLSKVEAGKLELNFTSVNLASLVDQCISVLQDHAAAARVVVRKNIPTGLPNVVADLRSVKQILLNLISNAVKFTDAGGQVIVSARLARTGELTVAVKDTGIGMSEAELKAALQPFKRIESPGRDQTPGTGLGLPLSRALAEANRATFAISSEPRKGTLVEITFPTTRVLAG
jgi:PAS domain S-box-containing protein